MARYMDRPYAYDIPAVKLTATRLIRKQQRAAASRERDICLLVCLRKQNHGGGRLAAMVDCEYAVGKG